MNKFKYFYIYIYNFLKLDNQNYSNWALKLFYKTIQYNHQILIEMVTQEQNHFEFQSPTNEMNKNSDSKKPKIHQHFTNYTFK